jgi:hypothetical protein
MATTSSTSTPSCNSLEQCPCDPAYGTCFTRCEDQGAVHTAAIHAPGKAA